MSNGLLDFGQGAASGASAGSSFGPWGAAAGGALGGAISLFGNSENRANEAKNNRLYFQQEQQGMRLQDAKISQMRRESRAAKEAEQKKKSLRPNARAMVQGQLRQATDGRYLMAQLIIPNRLKDTLGAIEGFGQTYGNLRQLRLQNDRQSKLDAQSKLESDQRLAAGALGIESEKAEQARKMELRALESQLGQADAGQVMGPAMPGDFQAGMKDEWAPLKDRISAKLFTMQGQPTVSGDLKAKREDKAIADMRLQTKAQQDTETHTSAMATDKSQRALMGAQALKYSADATKTDTPPAKPPRDLTDGGIKALGEQGTRLLNVHSVINTFKPDYAGQLSGGISNKVGKITGGNVVGANPDQVGWWENYQGFVNQVRNELFGAALTPGEKAEFEKTIVKPNTDPEVAKSNLLRQWELVRGASERTAGTYAAGNVNQEQVRAAFGGAYNPETGKVGLGIDWAPKKQGASGSWDAKPQANDRKSLAEQALSDPDASPEEKAQAKRILGIP